MREQRNTRLIVTWNQSCRNYLHQKYGIYEYKRLQLDHWGKIVDRLEWTSSSLIHRWDNRARRENNGDLATGLWFGSRSKSKRNVSLCFSVNPYLSIGLVILHSSESERGQRLSVDPAKLRALSFGQSDRVFFCFSFSPSLRLVVD